MCRATDLFFYGQLLEWEMCFCCEPLIYPPVSVYLCTHSVTVFLVPQWYNMGVNACRIWRQAASQPATKPTTSFKPREGKKIAPENLSLFHTHALVSPPLFFSIVSIVLQRYKQTEQKDKKKINEPFFIFFEMPWKSFSTSKQQQKKKIIKSNKIFFSKYLSPHTTLTSRK